MPRPMSNTGDFVLFETEGLAIGSALLMSGGSTPTLSNTAPQLVFYVAQCGLGGRFATVVGLDRVFGLCYN